MNFREWLVSEGSNPGAKTGLYPLGYGGIGLYPPQWYPTRSADAIFYMSIDDRIYKGRDGGKFDISHLPPKSKETMNAGDDGLWSISHLKGRPSHPINRDYAAKAGEKGVWDITHLKGGKIKPAVSKDYAANIGEKGTWDISGIKK
jgi:hypothetical protein